MLAEGSDPELKEDHEYPAWVSVFLVFFFCRKNTTMHFRSLEFYSTFTKVATLPAGRMSMLELNKIALEDMDDRQMLTAKYALQLPSFFFQPDVHNVHFNFPLLFIQLSYSRF